MPTTIYVTRQRYSSCVGPFFSSRETARAYFLHHYRHASNAEQVAEEEVRALVPIKLDEYAEIECDVPEC